MAKKHRPNPSNKKPPRKLMADAIKNMPRAPDQSKAVKMFITPALAKRWLEGNTENRPRSSAEVVKLRTAIESGRWEINGETIKFDVHGVLRDGQTRLEAIEAAGKGVWCWVIYDINPGTIPFETIDIGRKRSLGQMLAIRGYRNYHALAGAINVVYSHDPAIQLEPGGFTPRLGLRILEERPEIVSELEYISQNGLRNIYSMSTAAGFYHIMRKSDRDSADSYWQALGTGIISNKRSPCLSVRDTLLTNKKAKPDKQLTQETIRAIIIKGWLKYRQGKTCQHVRWNSEKEAYPQIV